MLLSLRSQITRPLLVICLMLLTVIACNSSSNLKPFASDGCSLFPDASEITQHDWCDCCFKHDLAYWRGGTATQRQLADLELRKCVLNKTQNSVLADLMFKGVRFGGSPYFYNNYRWGYGWSYDRKYHVLTPQENTLADQLLDNYFSSGKKSVCGI